MRLQEEEENAKPLSAKDVTISADALQQLRQLQDTSSLAALEKIANSEAAKNSANGKLPQEDLERISSKLDKVQPRIYVPRHACPNIVPRHLTNISSSPNNYV